MLNKKILVVDDEPEMRELVNLYLRKEGYDVLQAEDGDEALKFLPQFSPHLILLDVMMPKIDGFTLAKQIQEEYSIPIIFLTARGDEWDRIHGLKLGADDYIVKPFSTGELLARVEAVLRRTSNHANQLQDNRQNFGSISFELKSRKAFCYEKPLSLTLKEYELLLFLATHKSQVFSREHLLEKIWGIDYTGSERTVDTHIKTLRLKLDAAANSIQTVWGVGYKFEAEM
ncbi:MULTISPECIES: response regulator transcription factor [Bacillaceae]|uniref:response regulator transcription factor n=1 Tax=Bacillaceae TaxID=186817 RepID=UPI000BFDA1D8|nr:MULTISPECIES: response regulator transcription factor [Bacillaceae]PGT91124.1 DNA-binding response regulator [Bacillus sp. AFS040349]UGB29890.1 response regulator transcription factor [Metabacillus sp. B2-18]